MNSVFLDLEPNHKLRRYLKPLSNSRILIKMAFAPPPPPKNGLGYYRILSPTAAVRVSPLCLGAMNFGEAWCVSMAHHYQESDGHKGGFLGRMQPGDERKDA